MIDIERLDAFLMSDDAPENCMQISDLDGFLTGVLCSPDLIMPSEWFPVVWNTPDPVLNDEGIWATQEILKLYNEIATGLNAEPAEIAPLFWERDGDTPVAADWCEGFSEAFALRGDQWDELMETEEGQDWLFPILAHLFDDDGNSLSGASEEELPMVLDEAAQLIGSSVPRIFRFWQTRPNSATGRPDSDNGQETLPHFSAEQLETMTEQELFALLIGHEDRVPMEVIDACAERGAAIVPLLAAHLSDECNWSDDADLRDWWALHHAIMILGRIPGKASAQAQMEGFRRTTLDSNNAMSDWLSGYWPRLTGIHSAHIADAMLLIAGDNEIDWYPRVQAIDCLLYVAKEKSDAELESALDTISTWVADDSADPDFRFMAAGKLLDFPRERHRPLLESIVEKQKQESDGPVAFSDDDIVRAFDRGDEPSWLQFDNPWEFYEPEQIRQRQERWMREDTKRSTSLNRQNSSSDLSRGYSEGSHTPYVREEPKVGRNDPCPCGSGKKYKKCCHTRLH